MDRSWKTLPSGRVFHARKKKNMGGTPMPRKCHANAGKCREGLSVVLFVVVGVFGGLVADDNGAGGKVAEALAQGEEDGEGERESQGEHVDDAEDVADED